MPKSMRLFFVSILILCCCVSVAFAIEQPQKNDHARNLDQLIITHHQDRNRDGGAFIAVEMRDIKTGTKTGTAMGLANPI